MKWADPLLLQLHRKSFDFSVWLNTCLHMQNNEYKETHFKVFWRYTGHSNCEKISQLFIIPTEDFFVRRAGVLVRLEFSKVEWEAVINQLSVMKLLPYCSSSQFVFQMQTVIFSFNSKFTWEPVEWTWWDVISVPSSSWCLQHSGPAEAF